MYRFWTEKTACMQAEALQSLQALLRFPSVEGSAEPDAPFGRGVAEALAFTLELGRGMGFVCRDLDGYAGLIDLPAPQAAETVGILCHLDVVPPDGEWTTPPFEPHCRGGRLYARGAVDDKGPLIAALYAMKAVRDSGLPLKRGVRLICGTNEETGFRCVEYYKAHEKAPELGFSPDGDFPVVFAEKGIAHFELSLPLCGEQGIAALSGGEAANIVPALSEALLKRDCVGEAARQWADTHGVTLCEEGEYSRVRAQGAAAHASLPHKGKNAVAAMLGFLSECRFNSALRRSLRAAYDNFGRCTDGSGSGLGKSDAESGGMSLSPDVISLRDGEVKIVFDMRYCVSDSYARIEPLLRRLCAEQGWRYAPLEHKEPLNVGRDSSLVKTLNKVYNEATGENAAPIAIGGGTYSRAFRNFVAFGPVFPDDAEVAHMSDEYIELERFYKLIAIYAQAIYELTKQDKEV